MSGALADESFKLGKLSIDDVDRDWDSGSSASVFNFSKESVEGGYQYKVKGDGASFTGGCVTEKGSKSVGLGSGMAIGSSFAKLGCTCSGEGEPSRVRVYMAPTLLAAPAPTADQELDPYGAVLPNGVYVG